jgi:transcriptional regulator with XRE-family HTH domain
MAYQPSHKQLRMAAVLSELRASCGYSQRDVARLVAGVTDGNLSRMESGRAKIPEIVVRQLATLYNVPAADVERLCVMARTDRGPAWWGQYERWLSASFVDFLGCEAEAQRIWTVQTMFIPGLLQTSGYMRDLAESGPSQDVDRLEVTLKVRQRRQQRLTDPDLISYTALIGESALHWRFGSPEVHCAQLEAILNTAEIPNVRIRVLPFSHALPLYPLDFFEFDSEDDAVVFGETQWGTPQHEDPLEIRQARRTLARLDSVALAEAASLAHIEQLIKRST